ncbi:hypothetical protein LSH36_315g05028 [Paralvinella palmiformis]|uniref:guanylate cyclase n=1 Tax=Paralvinella palmiformis TaxID=53620 RepID=A0AAD9JIQ5_9ANNE|nr:hypothetical protein LSH36_315g05028 [Paralvinella palmiformis]
MGATVDPPDFYLITEYCTKGSLQDLLENDDIVLDLAFKYSLIGDILNVQLLWTPPELLTDDGRARVRTPQADIYALGIILQEIIYREGTFFRDDSYYESKEIVKRVRQREMPPFRPFIGPNACKPEIFKSGGLMDNLLQRMEHYAKNLESMVSERTAKYQEEKKRAEDLLHRLLPRSIALDLQTKGFVMPKTYDSVTVYFSDIVEFTKLCSQSSPMQVVNMLNDLYTMCDEIIAKYDVYKVSVLTYISVVNI